MSTASGSLGLVLSLAILILSQGCAVFGENPSGARLEHMKLSKQYQKDSEVFQNADPRFALTSDFLGIMKEMMFGDQTRLPRKPLPEVKPDLSQFLAPSDDIKFIWLGHSTFLIRIQGKTILVDPVFGPYASPVPLFFGKRFQPPLLNASTLPPIDVVVISHDHYDHLEMDTIKHFVGSSTEFVVPLGVGSHLESWGISVKQIHELDWWEETLVADVKFVCTPAQHFSGRGTKRNNTLWSGWVIAGQQKKIFYSGDSGYSSHFQEIGQRLGPFDLTFMEDGQYNEKWLAVHNLPEQAVQAHIDVKGATMVPVHWGAYELAFHDWFDPAERVVREAEKRAVKLLNPRLGELLSLSQAKAPDFWWRDYEEFVQHK